MYFILDFRSLFRSFCRKKIGVKQITTIQKKLLQRFSGKIKIRSNLGNFPEQI